MRSILLIVVLILVSVEELGAFRSLTSKVNVRNKIYLNSLQQGQSEGDFGTKVNKVLTNFVPKSLPALLCATILSFSFAGDALAVPSGGRSGGSSFSSRSSYSSGSSRTRSNYGSSYSTTTVVPMPMFSPFSYGFGFNPFYSPISVGLFNPNVIILGMVAYAAYQLLKNRVGGSDFSNNEDAGSLGSGATVIALQIALDSDWANNNNIMDTLARLASRRDSRLSERTELATLLSDASIALLRREEDWSAASVKGEKFGQGNALKAEPLFQRLAIEERTKFESESSASDLARRNNAILISNSGSTKTQAVVSMVVAVRGRSDALRTVRSTSDVKAVLQTLASEALTDDGDNIMAVELLWTPSDAGEILSNRDVIMDYPELIKL